MRTSVVPCWPRGVAGGLALWASVVLAGAAFADTPSAQPALGWTYPAPPLRVHVVCGYSQGDYRLQEALARAGAAFLTESTQEDRGVSDWGDESSPDAGWLRRYPDAAGQAMNHHLVVVCAVGARSFGKRQPLLVDFVKHGGSVLFLCGGSTFGDRSAKSAFVEMAPVEFPDKGPWSLESQREDKGLALRPGPDSPVKKLPGASPDNPPRVYSYYDLKPKPGAKVLLTAGEKPLLIVGEHGSGRVAVFAGTCQGYAPEGQIPFWRWDGWPVLLGRTLHQLAPPPERTAGGLDEASRRLVAGAMADAYDLLDGVNPAKRREFEAVLQGAALRCHDKATADFLLGLLARYRLDVSNELANALGDALWPWVDKGSAGHALALIDSGETGKTILGLVVLGATRADQALPTLKELHATGRPRPKTGSEAGLVGDPAEVGAYMQARENAAQIRRAAVTGLGHLGSPAALAVVKKAAAACAPEGRFQPDAEPDAIEPQHRDYQNALLASLLCGDAEAAGPLVDCLLENLAIISRAKTAEDGAGAASAVSGADWQQRLYGRLPAAPDRVLPALARRIAGEKDRRVARAALAALGGRKLSPEVAALLRKSPVATVAALSKQPK